MSEEVFSRGWATERVLYGAPLEYAQPHRRFPAFVIHLPSAVEREPLVEALAYRYDAHVLETNKFPKGKDGCRLGHLWAAQIAKQAYPDKSYLVFEDDCSLNPEVDQYLPDWQGADVVYLGYNNICEHTIFGTHALLISPKARDCILDETERLAPLVGNPGAYDWILSELCRRHQLVVLKPPFEFKDKWATQKKGLESLITGNVR